jgi:hypothetical protein
MMRSFQERRLIFFQERLLLFTGNSTNLLLQISELNELRERLRKAEQSAQKVRQSKQRKRMPVERFCTSLMADS